MRFLQNAEIFQPAVLRQFGQKGTNSVIQSAFNKSKQWYDTNIAKVSII